MFLTLEQLRAAFDVGGILAVTIEGKGGLFYVRIETRRGGDAVLVTARAKAPRAFVELQPLVLMLRDIGIREMKIDTREWRPEQRALSGSRPRGRPATAKTV